MTRGAVALLTRHVMTREEFEAARQVCAAPPYHPDWLVHEVVDHGPSTFYRYSVRGENLNFPEGSAERHFAWSVHKLSWRYFMP